MATQMNFQKGGGSYGTAGHGATVNHAQTNYGGRTTKKGGGNASSPQKNFQGKESIRVKTISSHFGEKGLTGNQNGY